MNWMYLVLAGVFEIGWPLGLKLSQTMPSKVWGIILAVISMFFSGLFLWIAQKAIPLELHIPFGQASVPWALICRNRIFLANSASMGRLLSDF